MLKADSQGFLIGEVLDVSKAMLEGQKSGLETLSRIDNNLASLMRGSVRISRSGARARSVVNDVVAAEPSGRRAAVQVGAFGQAVPKVAAERIVSAQVRAAATVTAQAAIRDARGRFVKRGGAADDEKSPGSNSPGSNSPDRGGSKGENRIVEAIKDAAIATSDRMDPMIETAKEVWEPLGRGWRASFGQGAEKKKERWYKRIWKALTGQKGEGQAQAAGGSSGGMLSGITAGITSRLAGLASMIPTVLARVFAPVAAVWAAWEVGQWIGGKFNDWLVSSGMQSKMFDWIDSMRAGWASLMDRWGKIWDDNVGKPVKKAIADTAAVAGQVYDGGIDLLKGAGRTFAEGASATNTWLYDKTGFNVGEATSSAASGIRKLVSSEGTKRVYELSDGSSEVRQGGSVSWRNNNPGNLKFEYAGSADPTAKSKRSRAKALEDAKRQYMGVVDLDQFGNLIFSTPEQGREAQLTYMKKNAPNKTIEEMLSGYARPDYSGPTHNAAYASSIYKFAQSSGFDLQGKKIGSMSPAETAVLASAMQSFEGFNVGSVTKGVTYASAPMISPPVIRDMGKLRSPGPVPDIGFVGGGSNSEQPVRISIPDVIGQNVSDRAIAHIATGGIGGL